MTTAPVPGAPHGDSSSAPRRRGFAWGLCLLGLVAGTGGLIGAKLGHVWIHFDVFAQFTAHFVILTFAAFAGLLAPRARIAVVLALAVAGVVGIGVWPQWVSRSPRTVSEASAGERALSVLSFNSWYGNQRVAEVEAEIVRIDADIVALVEFGPNKHPILERLAARYPYRAQCFAVDYCHLAILSKVPIATSDYRMAWEGPPLLIARLGGDFGGLTIFAAHTIRFPHSRAQYRQVRALSKLLAETPGDKVLMGDFNATPYSRVTRTIAAEARMQRLTDLPSWPAGFGLPQIAIDHVFATTGIRVLDAQRIGNPSGSDHLPIYMTLAVPAGG